MPQPAADMPQKQAGKAHQVRRDPPLIHEISGQHEQRNGKQGKGRQAAEDGLNQRGDGHVAAEHGIGQGAAAQGHNDGCGDAQQPDKSGQKDDHRLSPFGFRPINPRNSSSVRKNMMKKPVGSAA